ncbi:hypothetical protein [Apibacter sp. HY039]|uniref:hypothetical protein n=1 Tax=Apibacter sp. HY039 TaxID=2501476 RepID=UPI000FEBAC76|nr:hypothetical protein [Apibacter sp. HY039]
MSTKPVAASCLPRVRLTRSLKMSTRHFLYAPPSPVKAEPKPPLNVPKNRVPKVLEPLIPAAAPPNPTA